MGPRVRRVGGGRGASRWLCTRQARHVRPGQGTAAVGRERLGSEFTLVDAQTARGARSAVAYVWLLLLCAVRANLYFSRAPWAKRHKRGYGSHGSLRHSRFTGTYACFFYKSGAYTVSDMSVLCEAQTITQCPAPPLYCGHSLSVLGPPPLTPQLRANRPQSLANWSPEIRPIAHSL